MSLLTVTGVISGLFATSMFTLGSLFQKRAVTDSPEFRSLVKNKHWLGGLFISLVGAGPFLVSQYLIGIGFTQMLMAFGMVVLALVCKFYLRESINWYSYLGIVLIIGGIILLGFSRMSPVEATLTIEFYKRVLSFYLPSYLISLLVLSLYKWVGPELLALSSGVFLGNGAGFSQMTLMSLQEHKWPLLVVFGPVLILSSVLGTVAINIAYREGRAITLVPILNLGNYLLPIVSGIVVFGQHFTPETNLWYFFLPSVLSVLSGVLLLTRVESQSSFLMTSHT